MLDRGLPATLADLAGRAPLPVHVRAPVERLPADVEAAAYVLASEAVTNVVNHAGAVPAAGRRQTSSSRRSSWACRAPGRPEI